jgi:hypothetical protein
MPTTIRSPLELRAVDDLKRRREPGQPARRRPPIASTGGSVPAGIGLR